MAIFADEGVFFVYYFTAVVIIGHRATHVERQIVGGEGHVFFNAFYIVLKHGHFCFPVVHQCLSCNPDAVAFGDEDVAGSDHPGFFVINQSSITIEKGAVMFTYYVAS